MAPARILLFGQRNSYTGVGAGNRDIITDFSQGDGDKIDLSAYGTVYYTLSSSGGNTVVRFNEAQTNVIREIELTGNIAIVNGDFIGTVFGRCSRQQQHDRRRRRLERYCFNRRCFHHHQRELSSSTDFFYGYGGDDTLNLSGGGTFTVGDNLVSVENLVLSDHSYTLTVSNSFGLDTIDASALNAGQTLTLTAKNNLSSLTITGGDDNDTITGGMENDIIYGGTGNDTIQGSTGDDTLYGQDGADILSGGMGSDTIVGGNGNDTIYGDNLSTFLASSYGTDFLWLDGSDPTGDGSTVWADGSTVSTWTDKASHATSHNFTTAGGQEPTYLLNGLNGYGAVRFDGVNDYLRTLAP